MVRRDPGLSSTLRVAVVSAEPTRFAPHSLAARSRLLAADDGREKLNKGGAAACSRSGLRSDDDALRRLARRAARFALTAPWFQQRGRSCWWQSWREKS
jgi:hypothetical protein